MSEFFAWKEVWPAGDSLHPEDVHLVTPHSDPREYEYPIDLMHLTKQEAIAWLDDQFEECPEEIEGHDNQG